MLTIIHNKENRKYKIKGNGDYILDKIGRKILLDRKWSPEKLHSKLDNIGNQVIELYNNGCSKEEVARYFSVYPAIVDRFLRKKNIYIRSNSEARKLAFAKGYIKRRYGKEAPGWRGGKRFSAQGYIEIYSPEAAKHRGRKDKYVLEHILVWEYIHNKQLPEGWVIHHLNGIKIDNRPENLIAMPRGKHGKEEFGELYKQRIRQLEAEIILLKRILENNQLVFHLGEN